MCQLLVEQEKASTNQNKIKRCKQRKPTEAAKMPKFDMFQLSDSTASESSLDSVLSMVIKKLQMFHIIIYTHNCSYI